MMMTGTLFGPSYFVAKPYETDFHGSSVTFPMFPYGESSLTEPQDYFLTYILKASPLSRITDVGIFSLAH